MSSTVSVDAVVDRHLLDQLVDGVVARPRADRVATVAPFTGRPIAQVPVSTVEDVATAAAAARDAARGWATRPVVERARIIGRIHDLVLGRRAAISDLVQAEAGKARRDAFEEVADVALAARYVAARGPRVLRERRRLGLVPGLTRAVEGYRPKGVVGVISPWNYPLTLAISDCLPAFVAGNAVLHKPDQQAMLTALLARSIAIEAGVPEALWQIVSGDGPLIGGAVLEHADYVSFTGSTATGRIVAARLGERLVGASLELGGKNPMLVLDDADLDRAAECAARACFSNAGQLCMSMERLYVAAPVRDAFLERFLDRVDSMRVGAAFDYSRDLGSLMSQAQLDKVTAHVEDAAAKGARVLTGGRARPDLGPWFHEPTVLDGVRPGMLAADVETFGPVVAVHTVGSDDEAIDQANNTPFGLNASVWTSDPRRGVAVARRLRSGTVNVNEGYAAAWGSHDLPIGGMGASGLGRRHGREGILRYTDTQAIAVQRAHGITPLPGMDYDAFAELMTRSLRTMRRLGRR
ncbi:succinic semialdehyde dehydrogenase [Jiangella asiatica]|uniref:Succinate-semialdehyde dehydrogenase (NADP(+)) n=1 Tax=Jiangella asiatica TaxID=2530372 RepID=A0A4R5DXC5_9ACTN|nr:succinic semialdehyde dehydrogenase [Jiangella asiatica]TDE15743.1 succinate-semialdehyde dehydrogenase (NADP(+)) [Jiangella asiatica]